MTSQNAIKKYPGEAYLLHGEHGSLRSSLVASKTVHVYVNDCVNVPVVVDVDVNGFRHAKILSGRPDTPYN